MDWQILLVINLFSSSLREFLNKKIVNKIDPYVALFYISLFNGFWFYLLQFATVKSFPKIDPLLASTGTFFVIGFTAYLAAVLG